MRSADIAAAADGLRRLLSAVERGELTASPGEINRLEGAAAALEAIGVKRRSAPSR